MLTLRRRNGEEWEECWPNLHRMRDPETALVIIVPCWQTQPWIPQSVQLVKTGTTPLLIPAHPTPCMCSSYQEQTLTTSTIWDRLSLVAAILSGTSQQQDCHLMMSPRSSEHEGVINTTVSMYNTPVRAMMAGLLQQTAA